MKDFYIFSYPFILQDLFVHCQSVEVQKALRCIFAKEVAYFSFVYSYLLSFKKLLGVENEPGFGHYREQFEAFNSKIVDFLLCTVAHLHMVFILRVELFLSDYSADPGAQKVFSIFNKRKKSYKLSNVDTND